jgi:hypothetical protein
MNAFFITFIWVDCNITSSFNLHPFVVTKFNMRRKLFIKSFKVWAIISDMMTTTTIKILDFLSFVFCIHTGIEQLIFFLWKFCYIVLSTAIYLIFVPAIFVRMSGIFPCGTLEETISSSMTSPLLQIEQYELLPILGWKFALLLPLLLPLPLLRF